jgi:hypothetical protein
MKRRVLTAAVLVLGASVVAVDAQTAKDQVIRELTELGYREFTVQKTWLGRVRIVARGQKGEREVVLNPSTGVVLRDYTDRSEPSERELDEDRPVGRRKARQDRRDRRHETGGVFSASDRDDDHAFEIDETFSEPSDHDGDFPDEPDWDDDGPDYDGPDHDEPDYDGPDYDGPDHDDSDDDGPDHGGGGHGGPGGGGHSPGGSGPDGGH